MPPFQQVLFFLVPIAYFGTALLLLAEFRGGGERFARTARWALLVGALLHCFRIGWATYRLGALPLGGVFPFLSLLALSVAIVELYLGIREEDGSTSLFLVVLVSLLELVAVLGSSPATPFFSKAHPVVFGLHVGSAIFGYAAAAIAAIHGGLYLLLYHQIKTSHFGRFYKRLPPLGRIDIRISRAVVLSFLALSVSLLFGMRVLRVTSQTYWVWDAKVVATLVVWVFFGGTLASRWLLGWSGRRIAILSMTAFFLALLSLGVVSPLLSHFHAFPR